MDGRMVLPLERNRGACFGPGRNVLDPDMGSSEKGGSTANRRAFRARILLLGFEPLPTRRACPILHHHHFTRLTMWCFTQNSGHHNDRAGCYSATSPVPKARRHSNMAIEQRQLFAVRREWLCRIPGRGAIDEHRMAPVGQLS